MAAAVPPMLWVRNDGPLLIATNYWDSPLAARGDFYLSWNAGTARLLVPDTSTDHLAVMAGATHVVVRRGPWPDAGVEAFELMFEDFSDSPLALHLAASQSDRLPPVTAKSSMRFSAWTRAGCAIELPAFYLAAARLPCLDPL